MAVFRCKMCGGTLEINNNESVMVCEYCGTKQTLPKLGDDRKENMYDRASHFRRNNEFDKAIAIYEKILNEDSKDSEAYWSLVLCNYGIEYVEDPITHKRVPTVNRTQFTSIFADENYKAALQYADIQQQELYEEEAKTIDDIQKGILSISQKEEPFDVFICYKETDSDGRRTPDSVLANDLYHQLKQEEFKVFFARITLEDKLGSAYEPYIFAALNSAKVMVVIGTKTEYFNAVWVKNEWSRYLTLIKNGAKKMLIPAYKDMDPYDLPDEFSHLQAQDMSKLGFMQDLIRGIKKITREDSEKTITRNNVLQSGEGVNVESLLKRVFMFLEDGDFVSATGYCEKVLDIDPENSQAYLGKLMAELGVRRQQQLGTYSQPYDTNNNYQKIMRFGNEKLRNELRGYTAEIKQKNQIYDDACYLQAQGRIAQLEDAIEKFSSICAWRDSKNRKNECLEEIRKIRIRLEEERIERNKKEKRKKQKRKMAIVCIFMMVIIIGYIIKANKVGDELKQELVEGEWPIEFDNDGNWDWAYYDYFYVSSDAEWKIYVNLIEKTATVKCEYSECDWNNEWVKKYFTCTLEYDDDYNIIKFKENYKGRVWSK